MNKSAHCSETGRSHNPPTGYRNMLKALVATTALSGSACGSMNQPFTPNDPAPNGPVSSAAFTATAETITKTLPLAQPSDEPKIPAGSLVFPMTIYAKAPKKGAWPGVPELCVFTGIVLEQDASSVPHKILLENMCLQKRMELDKVVRNIYEGKHRWVEADSKGRYEIPFENAHLEETNDSLIFVTGVQGNRVEEELTEGAYQPDTLSFENSLNNHGIKLTIELDQVSLQK